TREIGVGVIGMGWMGLVHSRAYRAIADRFHESGIRPRLVICADEFEARAREAQERLGFEECTTDWKKVVAHPAVEVVNIASPNYLHLEMVRLSTRDRKHVFCEKPVGRNSQETAEIARLARDARILSWVGYNYRWPPVVQYARQLIQSGKFGSLTH